MCVVLVFWIGVLFVIVVIFVFIWMYVRYSFAAFDLNLIVVNDDFYKLRYCLRCINVLLCGWVFLFVGLIWMSGNRRCIVWIVFVWRVGSYIAGITCSINACAIGSMCVGVFWDVLYLCFCLFGGKFLVIGEFGDCGCVIFFVVLMGVLFIVSKYFRETLINFLCSVCVYCLMMFNVFCWVFRVYSCGLDVERSL